MQYVRHFLEEATGATIAAPVVTPSGFSAVYLQSPNLLGAPYFRLGTMLDGSAPKYVGDRYVRFDCTTNAGLSSGNRIAFGWDVVNADATRADFEVLARFHPTNTVNMVGPLAIGARCAGTESAWNGYFAELRLAPTNTVAIVKGVAGVDTDLATAAVTMAINANVWVRFQGRGTTLKVKAWTGEVTDEPVAWSAMIVDATYAAAGAICWGSKTAFSSASNWLNLAFLSMGTGTDSAPAPPKTWNDYLAFLDLQDTLRCVLMEADPLGQDALGNAVMARVCAATMPFVSKPSDYPYPNVCYEELIVRAPRIRRRMNDVLRGRSTLSYGDMELADEVSNDDLSSRLAAWYSWNWDGRPIRLLAGHPGWRRVDFKTVFLGAVQSVYRVAYGRMGMKLRGPEARFTTPVSNMLVNFGPNASSLAPVALAYFFNAEPQIVLPSALLYQGIRPWGASFPVSNPGLASYGQMGPSDLRIGGNSQVQATRSITAVNAGTDTLTFDANHGALVGGTVTFGLVPAGPPAPLAANTKYYVSSIPAPNQVTLALNSGGATIDITGATTGSLAMFKNFDYDDPTGFLQLLVDPGNSRVTFDILGTNNFGMKFMASALLQLWGGPVFLDAYHGSSPAAIGAQLGKWTRDQWIIGDALDELGSGQGASWTFSREGGLYFAQLALPTSAQWSLTADDIRNWTLGTYYLPAGVERLGYQQNNAVQQGADLVGSLTQDQRDLYGKPYSLAGYTGALESGLEQPANHLLSVQPPERPTLLMLAADAATEVQRLYTLNRKPRSTYTCDVGAIALAFELGDGVGITYPRDGFQNGKVAVVVGAEDDLSNFTSQLEVWTQIDGQWPIVSASQPFASEAYY